MWTIGKTWREAESWVSFLVSTSSFASGLTSLSGQSLGDDDEGPAAGPKDHELLPQLHDRGDLAALLSEPEGWC